MKKTINKPILFSTEMVQAFDRKTNNMAAIKHIIFKGKERTGKSLFANIIFDRAKTLWIEGHRIKLDNYFLFDTGRDKWDFEFVVVDDPKPSFDIESFYQIIFADVLKIDRLNREIEYVQMPKFIFLIDSERVALPDISLATFNRRFTVLDFDKNTIADLTKLIIEEKIIINNHKQCPNSQ